MEGRVTRPTLLRCRGRGHVRAWRRVAGPPGPFRPLVGFHSNRNDWDSGIGAGFDRGIRLRAGPVVPNVNHLADLGVGSPLVSSKNGPIKSLVPARMDRLPWTRFHWSVVVGLGVSWILDGLEIQIVAAAGYQKTLEMSSAEVGLAGTVYLIGQVVGALYFGRLADKLGRKKLFILTLAIYLVGSGIAGLAFAPWFLYLFRFVAGLGIGGEYAAINSAIDELIPSRYRGRIDIMINGTYWAGAALGAFANLFFLNPDIFSENSGWRLAFFIGPVLGLAIIFLRRSIPESPRWLMTHGREDEAERTVDDIEARVRAEGVHLEEV